jgi:hypothetical protein
LLPLLSSCTRGSQEPSCSETIRLDPEPKGGILEVPANRPREISATVQLCKGDPTSYTYAWYYDLNGNKTLDEPEKTPVSLASHWTFLACASEKGTHLARVEARPIGENAVTLPTLAREFLIEVTGGETPKRPSCYLSAKEEVLNLNEINRSTGITEVESALSCVAPYVAENRCDFEASYFDALLRVTKFATLLPERFENRNALGVEDVVRIVDEEMTPVITTLLTLDQKAPDDFVFEIPGKYQLTVFEDLPYLEGDETIYLVLQGKHDMAFIRAISALAQFFRGAFDIALSYRGLVRFILDTPRLDQVDLSYRHVFLSKVENDSTFLTLDDTSSPSAFERLSRARGSFMDGILRLIKAVDTALGQQDLQRDQRLRILRYWDCGSDGKCPCNDPDLIYIACPNRPDDYPGPDNDGTEKNGRFDPGEPVGTDRFMFPDPWVLSLPSNLDQFKKNLRLIYKNLEGPDPLDLNEIVPGIRIGMDSLGIPYPEIRLSEWFVTPSNPRDLLPLYSRRTLDFFVDTEGEPFQDLGYDGKPSRQESIIATPNPRNLPLGTPYDPITNPDPHFDDLDGFCNRICNFSDRMDNDGDGIKDNQDEAVFQGLDIPLDLGVESNFTFDFVDLNGNWVHDCTEPSEPFDDIGVLDKTGNRIGAGNGRWDFADRSHPYPKGSDVGPRGDLEITDPPNGTNGDPAQGIPDDRAVRASVVGNNPTLLSSPIVRYEGHYDPYYFFFPDPTFSGVLRFPDEVISINGQPLTANAKLHRFFNKILEIAALFSGPKRRGDQISIGFREGNAHPCSNPTACLDAVQKLGGIIPDPNACPP